MKNSSNLHWQYLHAPIGYVGMCSDKKDVREIISAASLEQLKAEMERRHPGIQMEESPPGNLACVQLQEYFNGNRQQFDFPMELPHASDFAREILNALRNVPYGETVNYGELAKRAGRPLAARAVGRVMANNPLPIAIPCHRVIGKSGQMIGYSGGEGIKTKVWLLEFEREHVSNGE